MRRFTPKIDVQHPPERHGSQAVAGDAGVGHATTSMPPNRSTTSLAAACMAGVAHVGYHGDRRSSPPVRRPSPPALICSRSVNWLAPLLCSDGRPQLIPGQHRCERPCLAAMSWPKTYRRVRGVPRPRASIAVATNSAPGIVAAVLHRIGSDPTIQCGNLLWAYRDRRRVAAPERQRQLRPDRREVPGCGAPTVQPGGASSSTCWLDRSAQAVSGEQTQPNRRWLRRVLRTQRADTSTKVAAAL